MKVISPECEELSANCEIRTSVGKIIHEEGRIWGYNCIFKVL